MSTASPGRLAAAGSLALALALASPVAAFADPGSERGEGQGSSSSGKSSSSGNSSSSGKSSSSGNSSSSGKSSSSGDSSSSGKGRSKGANSSGSTSSASNKGSSGSAGKSGSSNGKAGGDARSTQSTKPGDADPRGNNGTVKIDGQPFDDGRGNEPHVGCVFAVDFYGFDAGDAASITFTGHAPTGGGLLHSQHSVISDDAAGGGQDRDATLVFSVQDQLSELLSVPPHPQQGWHVKLAVDVDSAPGGAKQKVFWIDCPQPAAVSGTSSAPATGGAEPVSGGAEDVTVQKRNIPETPIVRALGEAPAEVAGPGTAVAGTSLLAARGSAVQDTAAGEGGAVAAQGAARPQALPFTGAQGLLGLLALGVTALGAGGVAARLGSRRGLRG